jgi:NAD-dependent SIR2 family protein deacetylase
MGSDYLPERHGPVGVMRCKMCSGDVFSVSDLEDQTPTICDQCGATVGRWADVRAMTRIPGRDVVEKEGVGACAATHRGIAELSLVHVG